MEVCLGSWGKGIKLKLINLFNLKKIRIKVKMIWRILVKVEFISDGFELFKYNEKRNIVIFFSDGV